MKTLVKNGVSLMALADSTPVKMGDVIVVEASGRFLIHNEQGDITLYENVVLPENYKPKKFCFDGENWSPNYNWTGRLGHIYKVY
jgi:hypothetical protein